MTISLFDLTEHTQFSVKGPTGCHPDGLSLGMYIRTEPIHSLGRDPSPLDLSAYDAVEWDRALRMAEWILKTDEEFNGEPHARRAQTIDPEDGRIMDTDIRPEHKCPFCGARNLFGIKTRTNIYCEGSNQTEAVLRCHGCGSTVRAFGDTYEQARLIALGKWETRP